MLFFCWRPLYGALPVSGLQLVQYGILLRARSCSAASALSALLLCARDVQCCGEAMSISFWGARKCPLRGWAPFEPGQKIMCRFLDQPMGDAEVNSIFPPRKKQLPILIDGQCARVLVQFEFPFVSLTTTS